MFATTCLLRFPFQHPPTRLPVPISDDPAVKTLAELRETMTRRPRGWKKLLASLEDDDRKGARVIAAHTRRQLRAERAERARVGRLLKIERTLRTKGVSWIAGVDEAGRGPLAGPVVAAAVIFGPEVALTGLDDSKTLNPEERERLYDQIFTDALSVGVGQCDSDEIDRLNIHQATLTAMRRAIAALDLQPERVLIDGNHLPGSGLYEMSILKGDARSHAIAAASVVAKVTRDRQMLTLDGNYPGYGLGEHKGYACETHLQALRRLGPSPVHRHSFHLQGFHSPAYQHLKTRIEDVCHPQDIPALLHDLRQARSSVPPRAFRDLKEKLNEREIQLNRTGPAGERIAEDELLKEGYLILDRNVRLSGGEIDLVAQAGDVIAFIEVKSDGPNGLGAPEQRVTVDKQQQIARLAEAYLQEHATTLAPRFDVVSVEMATDPPRVAIFKDAFRA